MNHDVTLYRTLLDVSVKKERKKDAKSSKFNKIAIYIILIFQVNLPIKSSVCMQMRSLLPGQKLD
jgi:hypothetical protein